MSAKQDIERAEQLLESASAKLSAAQPVGDTQTASPAILGCGSDHPEIIDPRGARFVHLRAPGLTAYGTVSRLGGGFISNEHVFKGFDLAPYEALFGKALVLPKHDAILFGNVAVPDEDIHQDQHVHSIGFPASSRFAERRDGQVVVTRDDRSEIPQAIFRLGDAARGIVEGESGSILYATDGRPIGLLRATGAVDADGDKLLDEFGYAVPFSEIRAAL